MGKQPKKYTIGFKQQVVAEIESGTISVSEASRKYDIVRSVIDRWRRKEGEGTLVAGPSVQEKILRTENEKLKAKIGEMVMENDFLKKLQDYVRQQRKENTSVITGKNLVQFQGGAK